MCFVCACVRVCVRVCDEDEDDDDTEKASEEYLDRFEKDERARCFTSLLLIRR